MRKKNLLIIFLISFSILSNLNAQDLSGKYLAEGYFFHPVSPRAFALNKKITKIDSNIYQVDVLGDLYGWGFQFSVDTKGRLRNWVSTGGTYPYPASGFMNADNPGAITFPGPVYPGTIPWIHSDYDNTYDSATHTFYLHYGYDSSAKNQRRYTRQIYEKYVLIPEPSITSATPLTGTSGTQVIIKGKNLSLIDPAANTIHFGNFSADTSWVVSDNQIIAKVASGGSGYVSIKDSIPALPGFIYTPIPPVTNPDWSYVGKAGVSQNRVSYISAASGTDDILFVAFVDSTTQKTQVMKFATGKWSLVGSYVSAGGSVYTDIVVTKTNTPIVAFVDLTAGNRVTVKKLKSREWITLGTAGFAPTSLSNETSFSLAIDSNSTPYVASTTSLGNQISVYKYEDNTWKLVGNENFATAYFYSGVNLTIDKKSNKPYLIFNDSLRRQSVVMKYNGVKWDTVGTTITNSRNGSYYSDVETDNLGNVYASMQDDNGFERQSVFKFKNNAWNPAGSPHFSNGRSYYNVLAIDRNNIPYVLFEDYSYNGHGTVMKLDNSLKNWTTVGKRGFINYSGLFERHSLVFDTSNIPMVVFSDASSGGKLSVMKLDTSINLINKVQYDLNTGKKSLVASVFPNPVHSVLNIKVNSGTKQLLVQITDERGMITIQKQIDASNSGAASVDVSKLPVGVYVCLIKTEKEVISIQFLKQ